MEGGGNSVGATVKVFSMLLAWSSVLLCLFEVRMSHHTAAMKVRYHVVRDPRRLATAGEEDPASAEKELRGEVQRLSAEVAELKKALLESWDLQSEAKRDATANPASSEKELRGQVQNLSAEVAELNEDTLGAYELQSNAAGESDMETVAEAVLDEVPKVSFRGSSKAQLATGAPPTDLPSDSAPARRLVGFYSVGTTAANVGCNSFDGLETSKDMSQTNCRGATDMLCTGCYIADEDNNDKILQIQACSSAHWKPSSGGQLSSASHVFVMEVINADSDHAVEIRACGTTADCSVGPNLRNSYTLPPLMSIVGYCYASGDNHIYWQAAAALVGSATITSGNIDGTAIGDSQAAAVTASVLTTAGAAITGGTIDDTVIGDSSPAAVTATTLSSGVITLTSQGQETYNIKGTTLNKQAGQFILAGSMDLLSDGTGMYPQFTEWTLTNFYIAPDSIILASVSECKNGRPALTAVDPDQMGGQVTFTLTSLSGTCVDNPTISFVVFPVA